MFNASTVGIELKMKISEHEKLFFIAQYLIRCYKDVRSKEIKNDIFVKA